MNRLRALRRQLAQWMRPRASRGAAAVYAIDLQQRECVPGTLRRISPPGHYWQPMVAPDGQRIAFWGRAPQESGQHLWLAPVHGAGATRLTDGPCVFGHPCWFPDSIRIACFSTLDASNSLAWQPSTQFDPVRPATSLWIINVESGARQRLTHGEFSDERPCVSPDGRQLCFVSNRAGRMNLWLVGADGSGLRQLSVGAGPDYRPSFSPDGERIAYFTAQDDGSHQLAIVVVADGRRNVLPCAARFRWAHGPFWLADGRSLLVHAQARLASAPQLWWVDLQGNTERVLALPGLRSYSHGTVDRLERVLAFDSRESP